MKMCATKEKFTQFCVIIATFVLIVVVPASATSFNVVNTSINAGASVYIGETGINVTDAYNYFSADKPTQIGWWASAASISSAPASATYPLTSYTGNTISYASFGSYTGNWYAINATTNIANTSKAFLVAKDPQLSVDVWDWSVTGQPAGVAVSGKSAIIGDRLGFKVGTNMDNAINQPTLRTRDVTSTQTAGSYGWANIRVRTDQGITLDHLYNGSVNDNGAAISLLDQAINSPLWYWGTTPLTNWSTDATDATGQSVYPAGTYSVYVESYLNGMMDQYQLGGAMYTGKTVSATQTVTIASNTVKITANKDVVVRSKPFSVTITGKPNTNYHLWVTNTSTMSGDYDNQPPMISPYQSGVRQDTNTTGIAVGGVIGYNTYVVDSDANPANAGGYISQSSGDSILKNVTNASSTLWGTCVYANVTLSDAGTRTVEWTTTSGTKAQMYTIRVEQNFGTTTAPNYKSDEVNVWVDKGEVTIVAAGGQSHYLGEEIKISGTNTGSQITYLFIAGPLLDPNGAQINVYNPRQSPVIDHLSGLQTANVLGDNTWSWKWGTSNVALDAAAYTVYATSGPSDASQTNLSKCAYGTVSIVLKKPYISVNVTPLEIAKGENLFINGTATGSPSVGVQIWVMGKNYANVTAKSVNADSTFSYEITKETTKDLENGTFYVITQHPMQNNQYDIYLNTTDGYVYNSQLVISDAKIFKFSGAGNLQGSDASEALVAALNNPNVDDTYSKLSFVIGNASTPVTSYMPDVSTTCYYASNISISPSGYLEPDTPATASFKLDFPVSGSETFPSSNKLQLITELDLPIWTWSLFVNGVENPRPLSGAQTLELSGWDLSYPTKNVQESIQVTLTGVAPKVTSTTNKTIFKIQEFDNHNNVVAGCTIDEHQRILIPGTYPYIPGSGEPFNNTLHLSPGWNFISIPIRLAQGANTAVIFSGVDLSGHSIFKYDAQTQTWKRMSGSDLINPLDGIWIYSNSDIDIGVTPDTNPLQTPPTKNLYAGWNAMGSTGIYPATARDTLFSVSEKWTTLLGYNNVDQHPDIAIINGGSGVYADTRTVTPGKGYWVFLKSSGGTIAAISS